MLEYMLQDPLENMTNASWQGGRRKTHVKVEKYYQYVIPI